MILPIVAYGDAVLKREGDEIDKNFPNLQKLIDNMFETMYEASGVGLAAPQIGQSIRLFIVDASPFAEPEENGEIDPKAEGLDGFKKVVFLFRKSVKKSLERKLSLFLIMMRIGS